MMRVVKRESRKEELFSFLCYLFAIGKCCTQAPVIDRQDGFCEPIPGKSLEKILISGGDPKYKLVYIAADTVISQKYIYIHGAFPS